MIKPPASQSPGCLCQSAKQGEALSFFSCKLNSFGMETPRGNKCAALLCLYKVTFESWAHSKVAKDKDWHLCFCWDHGLLLHRKVQRMEKAHMSLLGWEASSSHPSGLRRWQGGISSPGTNTGVGTFAVPEVQLQSCQGSWIQWGMCPGLHYQFDLKKIIFVLWEDKLNAFQEPRFTLSASKFF